MTPPPETQARLAAEMARMMGWRLVAQGEAHYADQPAYATGEPPGKEYQDSFQPWEYADDAIAFADWAEREGRIHGWARDKLEPDGPFVTVDHDPCRTNHNFKLVKITPTCPFPHALTLAVCRAIEPLRRILEDGDE